MADDSQNRRNELRKEVRKLTREGFVLKEMKRLGFWPDSKEKPSLAQQHIDRTTELQKDIRDLSRKKKAFENKDAVLNKYKKERLKKSREQQKLNKLQKEDARIHKQIQWKKKQQRDIVYIGEKFSYGLKNKENNLEKLAGNKLPIIQDVLGLSKALDTTVGELRYLSYYRSVAKTSHYVRYGIPKKSGGTRNISAPKPRLKAVQKSILNNLLYKITTSEHAHGFIPGKSIVTNANPHIGKDVIVNMDLKDFFPSIDYKRVFGVFRNLGFSDQISTVLSMICTEPIEEKVSIDGEIFYIGEGERLLPQGAPSSPAITNIICRKLDKRMKGIADKLGFVYTRYADDMTFSCRLAAKEHIPKLKWQVQAVIKDEDFKLHPKKTQIMNNGSKKEVTGIVVNQKASISRKKIRAFRALLFQIEKDGIMGKEWGDSSNLLYSIEGFARYVYMVDQVKGAKFLSQVSDIKEKYAPKKKKPKKIERKLPDLKLPKMKDDKDKPWWKLW